MVKFYWTDDLVPEQYKGQDIESMGVDMYALDGFYLEKGKKVTAALLAVLAFTAGVAVVKNIGKVIY